MKLIFCASAHHRLLPQGRHGPVVHGGETFDAPPEVALELLTDPHVDVREAPRYEATLEVPPVDPSDDLGSLTRVELDEIAKQAGIDPKSHRTKQDLIDTLTGGILAEDTDTDTEPEAEGGEGPDTPQED